ncbi:linear amide C-N hydrolase [Paenibacillus sp. 1011MAR3C5]|uniref:linear amide C-N hydrolase n=1 Tax=Paenibacillus sp. 1011MAR3C5 TaxID=1675787 RepID=UPI000E6CAE64|nr:linear amide C-N hydrolase [Paenibacillus sp. 1011MAR3C5]RJE83936.1 linear amide C-N hydrolase [Paenibacillus sp. 1011MAR3C5]
MSTAIYLSRDTVKMLGKNQDVPYDGAYLFTNSRQVAKKAMVMPPAKPMNWISRFGSITVSQVGKEYPNGGMNEAGLVVEQTTLWSSFYPEVGAFPAIGELPLIQLLLDTCENVQEAIELAARVRIAEPMSRLHYIMGDALGECAVLEYVDGELKVYDKESLPKTILANTPYREALADLADTRNHWQRSDDDYARNSMERFTIAAAAASLPVPSGRESRTAYMLNALMAAGREDTAYSLVYDIADKRLYFRTKRYPALKRIEMTHLDFSPGARTLALDLHQPEEGDRGSHLMPYDQSLNFRVVQSFFRDPVLTEAFGWSLSDEMLEFLSAIPDSYEEAAEKREL